MGNLKTQDVSIVKLVKCHDTQGYVSHPVTMTQDVEGNEFTRAAGQRLKATRKALDMTQEKLAEALGVTRSAVNNWEKGIRMPDPIAMTRMKERYGATLDWIYHGDMSGLRISLADKIAPLKSSLSRSGTSG